jgi:aspartate racemase
MAWPSSNEYYSEIHAYVNKTLGGSHCARIVASGGDFAEIEKKQKLGLWEEIAHDLAKLGKTDLKSADILIIASNTMNKIAERIEELTGKKVLHIADAVSDDILARNIQRVGFLGTRFTMVEDFYKEKLIARGIKAEIPCEEDIDRVNNIIFDQLVNGRITQEARFDMIKIIELLVRQKGCQGIVLGCTELPLLFPKGEILYGVPLQNCKDTCYSCCKICFEKRYVKQIKKDS